MKSISLRLTLSLAALVTLTTALVLAIGGWLLSRQINHGLELLNEAEFTELRDRLDTEPVPVSPEEISRRILVHTEIDAAMYFCQVHDNRGSILFRSPNLGQTVLPVRSGSETETNWTAQMPELGPALISEFTVGPLHVQVASPLKPARRLLNEYTKVSAWLLAFTGLVSIAIGYFFSRFALHPVRLIRETASRIRGDNLSERIPVSTARDEISALAALLNQMFDRIETSFNQVKRFTADASHELKTPLALIKLNAEKLRPHVAGDASATLALEDLLEEISRLHQIIESLLFLSKAESGTFAPARKHEDTAKFISSLTEDASALAEDRGATFQVTQNDAGTAHVEANLLRQVLLNLVTNALNASPAHGTITLMSVLTSDRWKITVTDEGPGLPPEMLERIFERFVRYQSGDRETPATGHGLGLAICRSIVELHGGTIRAENRTDRKGLRITVDLPRS